MRNPLNRVRQLINQPFSILLVVSTKCQHRVNVQQHKGIQISRGDDGINITNAGTEHKQLYVPERQLFLPDIRVVNVMSVSTDWNIMIPPRSHTHIHTVIQIFSLCSYSFNKIMSVERPSLLTKNSNINNPLTLLLAT